VFELFQDLERFDLGDYTKVDDQGRGVQRLFSFVQRAAHVEGGSFKEQQDEIYVLELPNQPPLLFTSNRDLAVQSDVIQLLGMEHPVINNWFEKYKSLPAENRAVSLITPIVNGCSGLITFWRVIVQSTGRQLTQRIIRLGISFNGERSIQLERLSNEILSFQIGTRTTMQFNDLNHLVNKVANDMLHRELEHFGILTKDASFSKQLIGLVEMTVK
jgi:hypothetical protein